MNNDQKEKRFNSFLTQQLNNAQKEAVTADTGPILVIAGAGSGKTRVITARIMYLLFVKKVFPSSIVALTFTNKAATEMKERIIQFFGSAAHEIPFVGTFHGYCLRLLKQHYAQQNLTPFSILDEDDKNKMIRTIITQHQLSRFVSVKNISHAISLFQNCPTSESRTKLLLTLSPLLKDAVITYQEQKKKNNSLDFDDLLIKTVEILKTNPAFAQRLRQSLRHLLVDEYQDTNPIQHELLVLLAKQGNSVTIDSICAVGDEDQSIYSWRGATVTNILNFSHDFPGSTLIKIEQNYRSVIPILHAANTLISHNTLRNDKNLWSEKKADKRIMIAQCRTDLQEAVTMGAFITLYKEAFPTRSLAVLYRTHAQSRSIEEEFIRSSMPYVIIGNTHFYARKEIKDLLAYLRIIVNPFDKVSFFRILNTPTRGLGEKCEEALYQLWENEPLLNGLDILRLLEKNNILPKRYHSSCHDLLSLLASIPTTMPVREALQTVITGTNYIAFLKEEYDKEDATARIENINELLRAISNKENTQLSIGSFLDDVALMQDILDSNQKDTTAVVSIMTLHAAKGLEFDAVIVAGVEEGILPSTRALSSPSDLEEERRLLYVGITRAREHLIISHTRNRYTYGQQTGQQQSRFINEVSPAGVLHEDFSYGNSFSRDNVLKKFVRGF